jgi:hypothetical protein
METHLADFKDECESQSSPFDHDEVGGDPVRRFAAMRLIQSMRVIRMLDRMIAYSD